MKKPDPLAIDISRLLLDELKRQGRQPKDLKSQWAREFGKPASRTTEG